MSASRLPYFRSAKNGIVLSAALFCSACATAAEWRWSGVERVVAISDVHGAYQAMVRTLRHADIVDDQAAWSGGPAHLVVTGDVLDRGPDSRRVMDLLMRLESEAAAAGGQVHMLLGNHEVMNLVGDLRYVSTAEYAAFAAEESAAEREQAFAVFKASQAGTTDETELRRAFDLRAPPGFFGHRRAFAPDGRYGRWLLEQPFIVVINETAFVHAGLSPLVTEVGLEGVNAGMKDELAAYTRFLQALTNSGMLDATENFHDHAEILRSLPEQADRPAETEEAIAGAIEFFDAAIHNVDSPVWYRGNVACSALIESDRLDAALERIGAERVVIGHTPTATRGVQSWLDGRVVEIDTGMLAAAYGGSGHALVMEGDRLQVAAENSAEWSTPIHRQGRAGASAALSASELEDILATGEIVSSTVAEEGQIVEVRRGETRLVAHFFEQPRDPEFRPEIAAWRLDRLLDLGLVPVTAPREIGGMSGFLQLLPDRRVSEATRRVTGDGAAAWCPLPEQWNALYVFDALIGNTARHPQNLVYNLNDWHLTAIDHANAFSTRSGRPDYLRKVELQIGPAWVAALASLNGDVLQNNLGEILDDRRLRALGKRRDGLLEDARKQGTHEAGAAGEAGIRQEP